MRTIWQSLAWKEWHEHQWKLAALTVIVVAVGMLPMKGWDIIAFQGVAWLIMFAMGPLALFVGVSEAASERSRGTLAFLQALPVPMWKVALHKLCFGLATCIVPAVLSIAVLGGIYLVCQALGVESLPRLPNPRGAMFGQDASTSVGVGRWFGLSVWMVTVWSASLFLWAAACGANRKDEISAGAAALLAMIGWWTFATVIRQHVDERTSAVLLATAPGGIGVLELDHSLFSSIPWTWLVLPAAAVVHIAAAIWYVRRFGRLSDLGVRSPRTAASSAGRLDWLPPPRRSPFSAIAWKQYRESGAIALAGVAGVIAFVALMVLGDPESMDYDNLVGLFIGATVYFGFVVTLVVGIGLYLFDLAPNLSEFWRSRPIDPNLWHWTKFATGLLVLFVSFALPALVVVWLVHPPIPRDVLGVQTLMALTVFLSLYCAAVATTCLVRHAIYAAILSIGTIWVGVMMVQVVRLAGMWLGWIALPESGDLGDFSLGGVFAALLTTAALCMLIGWLAVRYDWGRKGRD